MLNIPSSSNDDEVISLSRHRRLRRRANFEALKEQYAKETVAEKPLILASRFYGLDEGDQEYVRCTIHDTRSVKRHRPDRQGEYRLLEGDEKLVAIIDLPPEDLTAFASMSPVSGETPRTLFAETEDMASPIASSTGQRRVKRASTVTSPASQGGSKRRKKNGTSLSKRSPKRKKRLDCPYVAGERLTRLVESSEEEVLPSGNASPVAEADDVYSVETIKDMMQDCRDKQFYFCVKWQGYPEEDNTWEPEENLAFGDHADRIDFLKRRYRARLELSKRIDDGHDVEWIDRPIPNPQSDEFNMSMRQFVITEKAKKLRNISDMFHVRAKRWTRPAPR
eukprot:Blabericola_migrator_1__1450@NODE_1381_length_4673_cov_78_048198_g926_i0_p3_GENE_NODE_1381_length_4673_cov_78_048198_g926_i0NODE_1381_length_4673_cov_78_048198_g926_i0_p3_ORF_typecomplete_len336_score60_72Chromo/PF00385_24/1_2e10_NODE_1381_length_4673_cov_78_048198_g926_i019582965